MCNLYFIAFPAITMVDPVTTAVLGTLIHAGGAFAGLRWNVGPPGVDQQPTRIFDPLQSQALCSYFETFCTGPDKRFPW